MLRKKTAAYALLAIYEIAQQHRGEPNPSGVRAGDVAQKHKLPKAYVAKILSQLASAGVLHSDRGPRGGFRLNRPMDTISLYDVFGGVGALVTNNIKVVAVKGLPNAVQAAMNRAHQEAAEALKDLFQKTTISDILGKEPTHNRRIPEPAELMVHS
jgi:Rrf2 family protein